MEMVDMAIIKRGGSPVFMDMMVKISGWSCDPRQSMPMSNVKRGHSPISMRMKKTRWFVRINVNFKWVFMQIIVDLVVQILQ
ncbi:hypothetical protein C8P63_1212 [Melghirimyces profundicolus]|uniref:Uncharacterized protein n=1 Tax=Melghirimyces profundicolus TaxID=1242148 RepID=A0A2T6BGD6_9BACL|nr:hypothetical protein [Melghirimyces profundicolus]PTX55122.1 hypothetical protein C8P63_1212 [Melghirimyces profundicolus]